jgi:hypothetical protein
MDEQFCSHIQNKLKDPDVILKYKKIGVVSTYLTVGSPMTDFFE